MGATRRFRGEIVPRWRNSASPVRHADTNPPRTGTRTTNAPKHPHLHLVDTEPPRSKRTLRIVPTRRFRGEIVPQWRNSASPVRHADTNPPRNPAPPAAPCDQPATEPRSRRTTPNCYGTGSTLEFAASVTDYDWFSPPKMSETEASSNTAEIASASRGAIETTSIFSWRFSGGRAKVLVMISFFMADFSMR
jgi:hypothetical protein